MAESGASGRCGLCGLCALSRTRNTIVNPPHARRESGYEQSGGCQMPKTGGRSRAILRDALLGHVSALVVS